MKRGSARSLVPAAIRSRAALALAGAIGLGAMPAANAQLLIKEDGKWRYGVGVGLSVASGNSSQRSLNATADAVKATARNKWTLYGRLLRGEEAGETTTDQLSAGARYDRELPQQWFHFGSLDWLRDRPANVAQRWSVNTGLGYHVFKEEKDFWDVFAGIGYSQDDFVNPSIVADEVRRHYGRPELLLGQQSEHTLTESSRLKQRLSVFPNLQESGTYRAVFDATLAVAINRTFDLTASLNYRYNSDPGIGLDKGDLLFVTGILIRME